LICALTPEVMPVESIGTLGIPSITGRPTGWTAIETGCAVLVLDYGISMYLPTKILRRDLRSVPSAQIFHGTSFLERFPPET
jgi:hypothetical protein